MLVVCNFQTLFEILSYSVWYAIHVNFIFSVFFGLMFNLKGPRGQNPRTTCGPRTTVWETLFYGKWTQTFGRNLLSESSLIQINQHYSNTVMHKSRLLIRRHSKDQRSIKFHFLPHRKHSCVAFKYWSFSTFRETKSVVFFIVGIAGKT